jgi:16S rRNA (adenine1518-N6/adenine1519-N6)-dimethyltransferase
MIPVRKRWGQHFLVSQATAERIADAARLDADDTVIEVGPGDGALTRPLVARAGRLLAIEIDPMRADALAAEFAAVERVRVVTGDALAKPFGAWLAESGLKGPAVLAANLPYNVATPILLAAIEEPSAISRAVATVQKEVARRFAARAGSEAYGYLSVRAAAFANARVLFDIPPGAFRPRPKVVSSVLELVPRSQALDSGLRDRAVALASLGFRQRRKTLANALSPAGPRAAWEEALEALGKDRRVRAEELSLDDFLALARMPRADAPARRSAGA